MQATISYFFSQIVNMNRFEIYMHDKCMRLNGNLTLHAKLWVIFGFVGPICTEKFFSKKAATQEPDRCGKQSSLQVNFFV